MQVRVFKAADVNSTDKWLRIRGLNLKTELCNIGFIVPGVAAAQLLQAENGLVIFDSLVTNPFVSASTRHKACNAIFEAIRSKAQSIGAKRVLGFTTSEDTLNRAVTNGYTLLPHVLLALEC